MTQDRPWNYGSLPGLTGADSDPLPNPLLKPPHRDFNLPHPETLPGEIWMRNGNEADFDKMPWHTKRMGTIAYDVECKPIPSLRPLFAQRQELVDANAPIPGQDGVQLATMRVYTYNPGKPR